MGGGRAGVTLAWELLSAPAEVSRGKWSHLAE